MKSLPESARDDDHQGSGEREMPARPFAPRSQGRQRRRYQHDDEKLTDFHADIEREQRPSERP
jgi:hypothetical protein